MNTYIFAVGVAALCVFELVVGFGEAPAWLVLTLGTVLIASGVPHGALDLWISKDAGFWQGWRSFSAFHVVYLLLAALTLAAFIIAPIAALALFLCFSVLHFSGDWGSKLPVSVRLVLSLLIIVLPTLSHPTEVVQIFDLIRGESPSATPPSVEPLWFFVPFVACAAAGTTAILDRSRLTLVIVIILGGIVLPPLVFFGAYFALWHSPQHLRVHQAALSGVWRRRLLVFYSITAVALSLAALTSFTPGAASETLSGQIVRLTFIGLASLTTPHMVLLGLTDNRSASLFTWRLRQLAGTTRSTQPFRRR